jgi:sec-independent protein translocase protein TatA
MLNLNYLAIHMPGFDEWIVIAVIGVLVFGKRLPEVGRSLGKGIVEFKKGLKGIDEEVERASNMPPPSAPALPTVSVSTVPNPEHKFDPITGAPLQPTAAIPPGSKFDPFTGKPLGTEQVAAGTATETKESGKWY